LFLGFSAERTLPKWRAPYKGTTTPGEATIGEVVLMADTFNTNFEPENLNAALRVLEAAGYKVHHVEAAPGGRPLCCGRTFLAAGLVDEAKAEATRTLDALGPFIKRGVPVVGLEPSCLLTLRDEFTVMLPGGNGGGETKDLADNAYLFEEFLAREKAAGRFNLDLKPIPQKKALLHGHCHQKAFAVMGSVESVLGLVPELEVETVESSCCGMAGAFGFRAKTIDVSKKMGELSLLPKVREADADTLIVADGTSCRHQIEDGTKREAQHVAVVLAAALK
jgi:Fe-S oxidoreductase